MAPHSGRAPVARGSCTVLAPISAEVVDPLSRTTTERLVELNARIIFLSVPQRLRPQRLRAQAILIRDNRVVAVGSEQEVRAEVGTGGPATVVDLGGRTVVPGFNDAHIHFTQTGAQERTARPDAGDCGLTCGGPTLPDALKPTRLCARASHR